MRGLIPWRKRDAIRPRREPTNPFELLHSQIDELFDSFFRDFGSWRWPSLWTERETGVISPCFEVSETDDAIQVTAELPGMDEKDIEVTLDENALTVRGEKKQEREEKRRNYYFSERSFGSFTRVIPLPAEVDRDNIKARFSKGVLEITLPKTGEAKSQRKRIEIKSE